MSYKGAAMKVFSVHMPVYLIEAITFFGFRKGTCLELSINYAVMHGDYTEPNCFRYNIFMGSFEVNTGGKDGRLSFETQLLSKNQAEQ